MIDARNQNRFYAALFQAFEESAGVKLDPNTVAAIIGFEVGGPIALRTIERCRIFAAAELGSVMPLSEGELVDA